MMSDHPTLAESLFELAKSLLPDPPVLCQAWLPAPAAHFKSAVEVRRLAAKQSK